MIYNSVFNSVCKFIQFRHTIELVGVFEKRAAPRLMKGSCPMMKFLKDSYNGLYVVLLKPYMPRRKTIALLIIGVLIGLVWGYGIAPTIYYDADPRTLEQSWQDEWVKLLADRAAAANADVSANIIDLLSRVDDPLGIVDRLLATPGEEVNRTKLENIRPLAEAAQANAVTAPQPTLAGNILPFIVAPLVVTVIGVVIALLWGLLIKANLYDPLVKRLRGEKVSAEVAAARQQMQAVKQAEAALRTDYSTTALGKPLMQRMSTYLLGHGQYDDSFSIEDEQEHFLGECGASISETIGTGEPQKMTAAEVWLFDKDDYQRTVTKVFVSEHAFNDPALRAKLEPKGEIVLAQPGAVAILETASLRLQARVVDVEYASGPLPPKSHFQKMTIELAAWRKTETSSTVDSSTMPAVPMTTPPAAPTVQYAPPPASPLSRPSAAPAVPPRRPITPPPAPPPVDDDDPFGGTGDFTPVG